MSPAAAWLPLTLLLGALVAPPGGQQTTPGVAGSSFERLQGFSTVVINHVNDNLGTENLPNAVGVPVEPGVFVTMRMDRLQIFDQDVVALDQGRLTDETIAAECLSGCPAALFDAFQESWLELAIEATAHTVEIPTRVLFATHENVPARTLVAAAYAAAETRPINAPALSLLVNSTRGGLRAQPFFLVPPRGLELRQGSAALGLTVRMDGSGFRIQATDPRYAREHRAKNLQQLANHLRTIKKQYPGKETVIVVPSGNVTVGQLMRMFAVARSMFPRLVLSGGQDVLTP